MKNVSRTIQLVLFLFVGFFFFRCIRNSEKEPVTKQATSKEAEVLKFEFVVENLTVTEVGEQASNLEKIWAKPMADKTRVKSVAYSDGTTEWEMEKMPPAFVSPDRNESPEDPNRMPDVKVTKIDRSGNATFYDNAGRLLYSKHLGTIPFANVVEWVKVCKSRNFEDSEKQLIDLATKNGQKVEKVGDHFVKVTEKVTKRKVPNAKGSNLRIRNDEETIVTDYSWGMPLGFTVYDAQGEILETAVILYNYDSGIPLVEDVYTESWADIGSLKRVKSNSHTHYDNISLTF